jgi:Na+-transporting NADH:ubiquinone oxidoreductase subunit NqrC
MKARVESGKVVKYNSIPNVIYGASGTVENAKRLPNEELEALGFYDVVVPDYDPVTQSISNLHFVPGDNNFTYDVSNKTISETVEELKEQRIADLNRLVYNKLQPTDFYITRFTEKAISIPSAIQVERDGIRSTATTKENEINALTDKAAILKYDINF